MGGVPTGMSTADLNAAALGSSYSTPGSWPVDPAAMAYTTPAAGMGGTPIDLQTALYGGTVGGSWSPEPVGNNEILYGHYSGQGLLTVPQAPAVTTGLDAALAPVTPATIAATQAQLVQPAATTDPAMGAPAAAPHGTHAGHDVKKPAKTKQPAEQPADRAKPKGGDKAKGGGAKTVTVKSGDSLSEIAQRAGVSWQKLYAANKGVIGGNPNLIRPGQKLKLP